MERDKISSAVIRRLPRYYRYLGMYLENGVERISSKELSERMGVTASQIRQDFSHFGGFGQQGYGYNVAYLYQEIGRILGLNHSYGMIIVGAGNLGRAICNHQNFKNRGFHIVAIFDVEESYRGKELGGVPIYMMDELEVFMKTHDIQIAALCIPRVHAEKVAADLVRFGIKGIWNFSSTELHVPSTVKVENVHLTESLMRLSYALTEAE